MTGLAPPPDVSSVARVKRLLGRYGLRPRKSLGQHFLVDESALRRIADAADLQKEETVIEVGPGLGVLTRELLQRVRRVIAVEKDERMAGLLRKELSSQAQLTVVAADVLSVRPDDLLANAGGLSEYKVVANLPYYVAAPILRHFLEAKAQPRLLVALLQKEVAQGVAAGPGKMTMLSVAMQLYATPRLMGLVRAGSFYPPPKVDSAIVRLDVRPAPAVATDPGRFFDVVRAGFSAPRKQIANSLSKGLGTGRAEVADALAAAEVSGQRRAESLSLEEWAALCDALGGPSGTLPGVQR